MIFELPMIEAIAWIRSLKNIHTYVSGIHSGPEKLCEVIRIKIYRARSGRVHIHFDRPGSCHGIAVGKLVLNTVAAREDEIPEVGAILLPLRHRSSPLGNLARHFRRDDLNHAVENRRHALTTQAGIDQIEITQNVLLLKSRVRHQRVQNVNVTSIVGRIRIE